MKTLYLDCGMGAAGDMLTAALLALTDEPQHILDTLNTALGGRARVTAAPDKKCGVEGLHVSVTVGGDEEGEEPRHAHGHATLAEIRALFAAAPVSRKVCADATAVFELLAAAESEVHGCALEEVHFHEIGSLDAAADVLGVSLLMEELAPDEVLCSSVATGGGTVKCAHGVLPVPAPATELLLRGIPSFEGEFRTELCTPTGAALLRRFVTRFTARPEMRVARCGYGTGRKDLPRLNAVRAMLGERDEAAERVIELCCNLDDMSGEEIAFACEELFSLGALDGWTAPIGMKKGRPGVLLSVLCGEERRETLLAGLFRHTTTLGVRERPWERHTLRREIRTAESSCGTLRVKRAEGFGTVREKAEYEDLAAIAREKGMSLREVRALAQAATEESPEG